MELVSLADIKAARSRIAPDVVRTPLVPVLRASGPARSLWLKPENLQPTGAFKLRGALNAVRKLNAEQRSAGVVTHSSGNHGQALAYAGKLEGVSVVVVIPKNAPAVKIEACEAHGAEVVLVEPAEREPAMLRLAQERGLVVIPPYDHPDIIAGQGTVGLEIAEDLPKVENVLVPVGGGGLLSGVAAAIKALLPTGARVIGVEPELAADAKESREAGSVVSWPVELRSRTIADGLRTQLSELTLAHVRELVDDIVTVTEEEIEASVRWLAREARIVAEPSGAVTTAAFLSGKTPEGLTAAVVSGGNVDPALYASMIAAS
ncbi:MAG: threonine ammonia-lyase [Segniliparus sp.]|uniref:threonine ammonia-lyase n=1 Tax=Segniliparus sp. TaxID=2804064 RepID=UPI003F3F0A43